MITMALQKKNLLETRDACSILKFNFPPFLFLFFSRVLYCVVQHCSCAPYVFRAVEIRADSIKNNFWIKNVEVIFLFNFRFVQILADEHN